MNKFRTIQRYSIYNLLRNIFQFLNKNIMVGNKIIWKHRVSFLFHLFSFFSLRRLRMCFRITTFASKETKCRSRHLNSTDMKIQTKTSHSPAGEITLYTLTNSSARRSLFRVSAQACGRIRS